MKLSDVIQKRNRFHKGVLKVAVPKGERMQLAVWVVTGSRPGPTLYIQAAQHPEYQGVGAIRDLAEQVNPKKLSGTLILVPLVSTNHTQMLDKTIIWEKYRMRRRSPRKKYDPKTLPLRNFYTQWPGDPESPAVEPRMVYYLWENFVKYADAFVDIHCWSMFGVPAISVDGKSKQSLELAIDTGYPYIYSMRPASYGMWVGKYNPESREMFMKVPRLGVPGFVLESTHVSDQGGWLIKENMQTVTRALMNLMKKMGMLAGKPDYSSRSVLFENLNEIHIKPKTRGFFIPEAPLGTIFKKGDVVGRVYDINTFELLEKIRAPRTGCFNSIYPVPVVSPKVYALTLKDSFKVLKLK